MNDTDHKVLICYSKDGGRTWSNWKERDLGAVGQYGKRIRIHRLGPSRQWVFKVRVSSARKHDLLTAVLSPEQTDG